MTPAVPLLGIYPEESKTEKATCSPMFTPVFFPGEFHVQRSLMGPSPWGCKELDTTEVTLHTHACQQSSKKGAGKLEGVTDSYYHKK